ncbi:MAG: metallophosphoesterase [Candidatus Sedimenticola sp. PURPLELP]
MSHSKNKIELPNYRGSRWIRKGLPTEGEPWQLGQRQSAGKDRSNHHALVEVLEQAITHAPWKWPKRPIYFLADPHADAEAFTASLVASGGVRKTGPGAFDIKLTNEGRKALFIIGGDCLDKGPSNLDLLRCVRNLMDAGARVKLLAGNHDVRLLMGIRAMDLERDPTTEHLFVRMGPKVIPLLKEIHDQYLKDRKDALRGIPSAKECRRKLYPSKHWFKEFPKEAAWLMPQQGIDRELTRMRKKTESFEGACKKAGLSMRDVYATALKCKQLFLDPDGEFSWFFHDMQLLCHEGSFLFIHAGLDDRITSLIKEEGIGHLNRLFRKQIKHDLFEFYYGPLANTMRTKYRDVDMPLTRHGVERAYKQGVHAIVHGHRNRTSGQRIMLRQGMIHIESDITMDRNSRRKEGLDGYGVGVTIIRPEKQVIGISTDYAYAKIFEPETLIRPKAKRTYATK